MKSARTSVAEANMHDVNSLQGLISRLKIILSVGINIKDDHVRNAQLIANVVLAKEMILLLENNTGKFKRIFPDSDALHTFIQNILRCFPRDDSSEINDFIATLQTLGARESETKFW